MEQLLEAGTAKLCSICSDAYNLMLWVPAAFTRLHSNSGQPLYGWLVVSFDLWAARFSGLQGLNSTPILFVWNHLPLWLKPEEKPVRNGLVSIPSTNQP